MPLVAADPQDAIRHAGQVVRRVLLRRNIVIDAETAQLVVAVVQAALQPGAPALLAGTGVFPLLIASRCSNVASAILQGFGGTTEIMKEIIGRGLGL